MGLQQRQARKLKCVQNAAGELRRACWEDSSRVGDPGAQKQDSLKMREAGGGGHLQAELGRGQGQ